MTDGYNKLLGGQLQRDVGYRYCVITYQMGSGQLLGCEILMLDKDLDIITRVELAEYITPEYASLTQHSDAELNHAENQPRVKLKKGSVQGTPSLVSLKNEEQDKRA